MQKNTVYYIAKRLPPGASPEEGALALAKHFVSTYELVTRAKVKVTQAPWERQTLADGPHSHGFAMEGTAKRFAYVSYASDSDMTVTAGLFEWKLLKTTQSGYEGAPAPAAAPLARARSLGAAAQVLWPGVPALACTRRRRPPPPSPCSAYRLSWP